jgi:hypothetical protein
VTPLHLSSNGPKRGKRSVRAPMQPGRELNANKTKQMSLNESKFTFICFHLFFRIWTFQWVTGEKIKKSAAR